MSGISDPQVLIQGGAVGIAIALIILLGLMMKFIYKMIVTHMAHSDDIMLKVISAFERNTDAINNNTKVTERVERILDTR